VPRRDKPVPQVAAHVGLSVSDPQFPGMADRSGTQRARPLPPQRPQIAGVQVCTFPP